MNKANYWLTLSVSAIFIVVGFVMMFVNIIGGATVFLLALTVNTLTTALQGIYNELRLQRTMAENIGKTI
jgi:hypothetical protein